MAGKVTQRLTPETRKLLPEHEGFYSAALDLYAQKRSPLVLKARDPEARTEAEVRPNGDVEITLVLPFDSNDQAADGRIYLKDRFLFDPTQKVLKAYQRSFELAGNSAPAWQAWLAKYRATLRPPPKLNDPKILDFALGVARTYALPLVDERGQTLEKFRTAFSKEDRHLDQLHVLIKEAGQRQGLEDLKLRLKGEKENHYQVLRRSDGKVELVFNLAADTDGDGANGRIWLKDRFLLEDGKLSDFSREWSLESAEAADPNYPVILESLKRQPEPDPDATRAFAENLYPHLVPQAKPHPRDLTPLLAAAVKGPAGESVFKDRRRVSAETVPFQREILELLQVLAGENLAKRADQALGLLSFGRKVDVDTDPSHLVSLFEKWKSSLERGDRAGLPSLLARLELNPGEKAMQRELQRLSTFGELSALAQEGDPELRQQGLLHLAERLFDRGYAGTALAIAGRLLASTLKGRAQRLIELAEGRGSFGSKLEFTLKHFHRELTKTSMLVGMMAAPFGGVAVEATGLRIARWLYDTGRISRLGGGAKFLASVGGMFGESLAFTGIHRGYERLGNGGPTAWRGAGDEILSSALLFGAMRSAHAGGTWMGSRLAEGKLNFKLGGREVRFGGRQGLEPFTPDLAAATPTGRLMLSDPWVPEAGLGAPALTSLGRFTTGLFHHFGGIAAMQIAGSGSRLFELAPITGQGFMGDFFDSTVAYLQAILGFSLANRLTRGRLQSSLGETKMRLGAMDAPGLPDPRAAGARSGLFRPNIPELRLFDLHQGGARFDFRILPGRETSLDGLLFGDEAHRVLVGMDQAGMYLIDRRPSVAPPASSIPANHCRIINLQEEPLIFNRQPLAVQTRMPIQEGDSLALGMRSLKIAHPRFSPMFRLLGDLNVRQQLRLGARIDAAGDLEALVGGFQAEGQNEAAGHVRRVWAGGELLHGLPVELGLQGKMEALIHAELRKGEREGLDELAVKLKPAALNPRWSPVERSLHTNRAIEKLQAELRRAESVLEAVNILRSSPFLEIEGKSIPAITLSMNEVATRQSGAVQDLPYTAGIRQRVRDIFERDNYWAAMRFRDEGQPLRARDSSMQADYLRLHEGLQEIYRRIRTSQVLREELPKYPPGRLEELVYQVLERGQPVEILPSNDGLRGSVMLYQADVTHAAERLFPLPMEARMDPWTGEKVDRSNREARYRLARHVLNFGALRPVLGVASHHERQELNRLVKKHLDGRHTGNFLGGQQILRDHFDRATPQAQRMLRKARPEEKALLLANYFGPFRRRDLAPATAFQVSTWMGQAGMFREVGVTYEIRHDSLRSTLSLGNLGNVEPQHRDDFFALHTHPELYLGRGGRKMGWEQSGHVNTIILENASISTNTLNILPSQVDLRLYFQKSQAYWRMGNPMKYGETPLFKVEANRFRNWVIHSLGLSKIDVVLDAQGQPRQIEVIFAARRLARLLSSEYQKQKQTLEAMNAEFGIPVLVAEGDYAALMSEMPYGVRSLFDSRN